VRQVVDHLESAEVQRELLELRQIEPSSLQGALVDYLFNMVDFFVNLVHLQRGQHLATLDRQNVFELLEEEITLENVKEADGSFGRAGLDSLGHVGAHGVAFFVHRSKVTRRHCSAMRQELTGLSTHFLGYIFGLEGRVLSYRRSNAHDSAVKVDL